MRFRFLFSSCLSAAAVVVSLEACSGASTSSTELFGGSNGDGGDMDASTDGQRVHDGAVALHDGAAHDDAAASDGGASCKNLECQQVTCDGGHVTTLSGTVRDPAKVNPIYAAVVYVPNQKPDAVPQGLACDRCGARPSGEPLAISLSTANGGFQLTNVPAGDDIPLVIQVGRWRRIVKVPHVVACSDNVITDADLTRLPKNSSEGNIPELAVATGGCDPFECLLRKIGIDDSEFTSPSGAGRVPLYQGLGGATASGAVLPATALWSSAPTMSKYDAVLNACECDANAASKPQASLQNMLDYVDHGGRWLGTHYQEYWLTNGPAPLPGTATFLANEGVGANTMIASVDTTFPKGAAFADWLVTTGASPTLGQVSLDEMRYGVTRAASPSTTWLSGSSSGQPALAQYSFTTPYASGDGGEPKACGKVSFSDYHEAAIAAGGGAGVFPGECAAGPMTPQEKALEFLFFDLVSCVQDDHDAPKPPAL
jgi:hypothetical protein